MVNKNQRKRKEKGGEEKRKEASYLIVNIMKDIFPKDVENGRGHEETTDTHP
jgi:hypothetical protein